MEELDLKDRKILLELDLNSRQSLGSIGKKVGLSKEVANYRIKKMAEAGIITGFYARIDTSRLGITLFRTFLRFYNLNPERQEDILGYITGSERVGWCVTVSGNWDFNFIYWADDANEFFEFWRKFLSKYGDYVEDKRISIMHKYSQFPKSFLLNGKKSAERKAFECGGNRKAEVGEKEIKILSILSSNSRVPTIEIAKKAGLSPKAVSERIKRMEKEGIILGYGISLDLKRIGYEYFKLHINLKRFDRKRFDDLVYFCRCNPHVIYSNELIGGADLELDIYVKNSEEYRELLKEVRYRFSDIIKNLESLQYYEELKHNLFPRGI